MGPSTALETGKEANVHFYSRHGFEVVKEAHVIGVPNWVMRRLAHRTIP